jgi:uroporphyrinogen-III synthase
MTPRLLVTRPADEWERTAEAVREAGFEPVAAPLFTVSPRPWALPAVDPDALLLTSPRAAPALAAHREALFGLPVFCVGARTAESARAAGFAPLLVGDSDGAAVVRQAVELGCRDILHPGGVDRIELKAPDGVRLHPVAVYESRAVDALGADAAAALADGGTTATLLFSPRAAALFASLVDAAGIARAGLGLVALSAQVAAAAGPGWQTVETARKPALPDMLAAAGALWHRAGHG